MIWRCPFDSLQESLIYRWIPRRAQQYRFRQFAIPSDGKADNRHAYGTMIGTKLRHSKHQLDFTLHAEQIGDMLKTIRGDRTVFPTLAGGRTFTRTFRTMLEHAWGIERGQGLMVF